MAKIEFCLLGSGAVRVNLNRGGTSQLLKIGDDVLLVDAGRNTVHNLVRFGYKVEDVRKIFITHLHFDHVCDLAQLVLLSWNNGRQTPLQFFGPKGLAGFLEHNIRQAYTADIQDRLTHDKKEEGIQWSVIELEKNGEFFKNKDYTLSTVTTPHGGMLNWNLKVEGGSTKIAITGDSAPDPALVDFAKDADLFVCECSGTKAFLDSVAWGHLHLWPEKLGEIVKSAKPKKTILKHLVVEVWSKDPDIAGKMAGTASQASGQTVVAGEDGLKIVF